MLLFSQLALLFNLRLQQLGLSHILGILGHLLCGSDQRRSLAIRAEHCWLFIIQHLCKLLKLTHIWLGLRSIGVECRIRWYLLQRLCDEIVVVRNIMMLLLLSILRRGTLSINIGGLHHWVGLTRFKFLLNHWITSSNWNTYRNRLSLLVIVHLLIIIILIF